MSSVFISRPTVEERVRAVGAGIGFEVTAKLFDAILAAMIDRAEAMSQMRFDESRLLRPTRAWPDGGKT